MTIFIPQDDEVMVSIMRHFKIEDWSITRLRQIRAGLTIHPLGPEFATMEALRLSFAKFLAERNGWYRDH